MLKGNAGLTFCHITQTTFKLTAVGEIVHKELRGIPNYYPQIKLGHYQIMPDHLHALIHVVKSLPDSVTLQQVIRGFKLGTNKACTEAANGKRMRIFQEACTTCLVFEREHLQREVEYVRDNVRRLADGTPLWGFGNVFLLKHPRRISVQFSRSTPENEWPVICEQMQAYLEQGYIFVSPFISPFEKRVLQNVIDGGGRVIPLTQRFFGERYKPGGQQQECEKRQNTPKPTTQPPSWVSHQPPLLPSPRRSTSWSPAMPGITGPATLKYANEEALLASVDNPKQYNDEVLFPDKVRINRHYLHHWSLARDVQIIWQTIFPRRHQVSFSRKGRKG